MVGEQAERDCREENVAAIARRLCFALPHEYR